MKRRVVTSHLYMALEEKRRLLTLEALADVKASRLHDHAEIAAWVATLGAPKRKTCP